MSPFVREPRDPRRAIALSIVVLNLETTLVTRRRRSLRIAFFLAIAFFVYLLWRDFGAARDRDLADRARVRLLRRRRARSSSTSAGQLVGGSHGRDALAVRRRARALRAFAMWRTWRDQRTAD